MCGHSGCNSKLHVTSISVCSLKNLIFLIVRSTESSYLLGSRKQSHKWTQLKHFRSFHRYKALTLSLCDDRWHTSPLESMRGFLTVQSGGCHYHFPRACDLPCCGQRRIHKSFFHLIFHSKQPVERNLHKILMLNYMLSNERVSRSRHKALYG